MISWLTGWKTKVLGFLLAADAVVGAVVGVYHKGRGEERRKRKEADSEQIIEDVSIARKVEREVDRLPDDAVDQQLRDGGWLRD